ncbi:MAG: helix-turn-helix domain-containing protein [Muribaculaceae bacterium]|nr:helix-turn-helix domain-containing protein [Muribaculaceae bacterium]
MGKEELQKITDSVIDKTLFCTKEVLTAEETARYMGISKSYLYKLTMRGEIPHYKPMGKMVYFNRAEVEEWLQQNRCATATEISDRVNKILMEKGGKR